MAGLDLRLYCLPDQAPVQTHVRLEEGWSNEAAAPCWIATASNVNGSVSSEIVTKGYPTDCVAVPEAPTSAALMAGLVVLACLRRRSVKRY